VELTALLVEPHPEAALLVEDVSHVEAVGRGDAGKGEEHHSNQGTIPQPDDNVIFNGAQQLAGLLGSQHGGLALAELLPWRLHGERRVVLEHGARD
jgi:hypothetical protein